MKFVRSISILLLFCGFFAHATNSPKSNSLKNSFVVLCYHDISVDYARDAFSVRKKEFVEQLDFLKANYNIVSLQDILDASKGKKTLPPKAVLVTVDDGLASFYENVFPLLKEYKIKAVFAIVGKWTEDGAAPDYGFKDHNPKMASWKQIKEMMDSGWVDIVSHTYNLHQPEIINPQGNQAGMAGFLKYNTATKTYQSDSDFMNHVQADLKKNNELIKKHLGKDNSIVVWPYGVFNGLSSKAAKNVGAKMQMTLRPGLNYASDLSYIGRGLVFTTMGIPQFAKAIDQAFVDTTPVRMIRIDIDSLWKNTEAETELELGDLLEQTLALGANSILIQAVSENGESYFPTAQLKVRGDYLNRTAHTIKYRGRVDATYARLPLAVFKNHKAASAAIRDLAKYTDVDGIFFEVSAKDNLKLIPFKEFMAAGRAIRPDLEFGLIGQRPLDPRLFNFTILNEQQLEDVDLKPSTSKTAKVIATLTRDYKQSASQLTSRGYVNLFFDVNFKGFTPDDDFKHLFSMRKEISTIPKGESK